jgi:hypothetical protein
MRQKLVKIFYIRHGIVKAIHFIAYKYNAVNVNEVFTSLQKTNEIN